ncbi:MAG: hypothetical protein H7124_00350 [Phycisphaerales bacterium]|nr:hypothetical protein [Hyphomonadaceae bacterium]
MSNLTYRRAEIEWALWRLLRARGAPAEPSTEFTNRIKKLLDLDRAERSAKAFAFSAEAPTGTGREAAFTPFDVFCLAIALDLLDIGLKQAEVVQLILYVRDVLADAYAEIDMNYPPSRKNYAPEKHHRTPQIERSGIKTADVDVYLVLQTAETKSVYQPIPTTTSKRIAPPRYGARLFVGQSEVLAAIGKNRRALVFELYAYSSIRGCLDRAASTLGKN